jgi:2'-5' RNA ligase
MAPGAITAAVREQARGAIASVPAFDLRLKRVARFPGVLYLAPEVDAPLVRLTRVLAHCFPSYPPYAGIHARIIPHLTVAQVDGQQLDEVEKELRSLLPAGGIASHCTEVVLMENATGRWREMGRFALGPQGVCP